MKNKVYYGEYSLKYWIELILKQNIILPEYQRTFVWNKDDVISLIESIKNEYFIPSVTIGSYNDKNLIIDGQQRLTSLCLAYLGKFPKTESFKPSNNEINLANNNDDVIELEDEDLVLGWTFKRLLEFGKSKNEILSNISQDYETFENDKKFKELNIDEQFFENHFLGFSYLIPQEDQQKYFSSVFRNINENGTKLSSLETRKALYFLKDGTDSLFDPDCIKKIYIEKDKKPERIDFLRYLSMDFQYARNDNASTILKNYARKEEFYYTIFIDDFINENVNSIFNPFGEQFAEKINSTDFKNAITINLKKNVELLGLNGEIFSSIIDCDLFFFGLVYFTIIKNKKLNEEELEELKTELKEAIEKIKNDSLTGYLHKKTPAALKYLRPRIQQSIEIYERHVK